MEHSLTQTYKTVRWKQPKCPSTDGGINIMWSMQTTEYNPVIRCEHGWTLKTWHSVREATQRAIPFVWNVQDRKRVSVVKGWGGAGEMMGFYLGNKNVLEVASEGVQRGEHTQTHRIVHWAPSIISLQGNVCGCANGLSSWIVFTLYLTQGTGPVSSIPSRKLMFALIFFFNMNASRICVILAQGPW